MYQTLLYMLSGVACYGGVHQLYLAARRPVGDHPHLLHGIMYLLLAVLAVCAAEAGSSTGFTSAVGYSRVSVGLLLSLWMLLGWFIARCAGIRAPLLQGLLGVPWALLLTANFGAPFTLQYADLTPVTQALPDGHTRLHWLTQPNPWWAAAQAAMLAVLVWGAYAAYRARRINGTAATLALAAGLLLLSAATLGQLVAAPGWLQAPNPAPFGFLMLLLACALFPCTGGHRPAPVVRPLALEHRPPSAGFAASLQVPAERLPISATVDQATRREPLVPRTSGREVSAQAETAAPAGDESARRLPSQHLIDIAVQATLLLRRAERGALEAGSVEKLARRIRARALATRHILAGRGRTSEHDEP
jgi:hypothetical protein